ncbi:MAG TPA: peptidylprolyl isomerase [Chryseosolibacter sp.]
MMYINDKKLKRVGLNTISFALLLTIITACQPKQVSEKITNENVKEVLLRYGKENPETEVLIETDFGNMRLKLYEDTPLHRANFVKLIKEGHYEEGEFYRIFYQFMIQGGDFDDQLDYMIPSEFNKAHIHKKGALSMARQDEDNPELKSSSTEFFIVHGARYADYQVETEIENLKLSLTDEQKQIYMTEGGYMSLDQQYTVFGEVIEGLDVVDKIASVKVYNEDKPLKKIPFKISVK